MGFWGYFNFLFFMILFFKDITIKDVPKVGGKNASLGEMYQKLTKKGVRIPNGFATTSRAYWHFINENKLQDKIKYILNGLDIKNIKDLKERGKKIRSLILRAKLPKDFEKSIFSAYQKMSKQYGSRATDVAVRSSATAEDMPSISENEHVLVKVDGRPFYGTIEELYDKFGAAPSGIEVPTMEDAQIKWNKITEFYKHPIKDDKLYKITTALRKEIVVSPNHSLIVLDEESMTPKVASIDQLKGKELLPTIGQLPEIEAELEFIDVLDYVHGDDVIIEDGLVMIKNRSTNWSIQNGLKRFIPIDKDFLYFLGLYAAEGSTYGNNFVMITNSNKDVLDRARRFLKSIDVYSGQKMNRGTQRVYCKSLVRFLHATTGIPENRKGKGRSCGIKRVPNFVFGLSKELIGEFLRGCYDGDGGMSRKGGVSYTSTSEMLAGGIVKLLEILGIKFYLTRHAPSKRGRRCYITINILNSETKKFKKLIGFYNSDKLKKLNQFLELYRTRKNHPEFNNYLEIPKFLSQEFREKLTNNLVKQDIQIYACPFCKDKINKNGQRRNKSRQGQGYYCQKCHKSFYDEDIIKKKAKTYVYYDKKGRFKSGATPWNRGLFRGRHPFKEFKDYAEKNGLTEYLKFFNTNVKWDRIKKIEPLNYSGYIYDFVVPGVENFAAGLGGIITHNSASFAGQMETYLNIRGKEQLLKTVKKCIASLFTDRAIVYREEKGFDHLKIALSVGVQKMIRSDLSCSGVMFSCDTESGFADATVINSSWGLGENVVQGKVSPDEFMVFEPLLDKGFKPIVSKKLGAKEFTMIYETKGSHSVKNLHTKKSKQNTFTLSDDEVLELAQYSVIIEKYYNRAMDIEWAKDGKNNKLYIVQARPETVKSQRSVDVLEEYVLNTKQKASIKKRLHQRIVKYRKLRLESILTGVAIGSKIGSGVAHVIKHVKDISKFKPGQVLVTEMTDPDWVPIMRQASAIVTNSGGRTAHAAIISRELGIPAIVGTHNATEVIKTGQKITVSCAEGEIGRIYKGLIPYTVRKTKIKDFKSPKTKIMMNVGEPDQAFGFSFIPNNGVGLAREEFIISNYIKIHPMALLSYSKLDKKTKAQINKLTAGYNDRTQFYIDKLAEGIAKIGAAFYPKDVIVRFSDFKSNEYANLIGGKQFEPDEANPMIGWRGASRYYGPGFEQAFDLECKAIKKVREEMGLDNVIVMVPFCRTVEEGKRVLRIIDSHGLRKRKKRIKPLQVYVMCEIPSNVILADKFAKIFDGFSIGSNDLTQLTLGVDRDSDLVAHIFDERNEAVKRFISQLIKTAHKYNRKVGICGQGPSDFPELARFLVEQGIDSMSLNPDSVIKTTLTVVKTEQNLKKKSPSNRA